LLWQSIAQGKQHVMLHHHITLTTIVAFGSHACSFPGMLADMLIGATNMIGFSWAASPVSTELEMVGHSFMALEPIAVMPQMMQPLLATRHTNTNTACHKLHSSSYIAGPHALFLHHQVMMDWLAQLMGLPPKFMFSSGGPGGGVIQGTTSEAVLVALLAAR
jgi:hypothetical protein